VTLVKLSGPLVWRPVTRNMRRVFMAMTRQFISDIVWSIGALAVPGGIPGRWIFCPVVITIPADRWYLGSSHTQYHWLCLKATLYNILMQCLKKHCV
jgi:hypothetical protein